MSKISQNVTESDINLQDILGGYNYRKESFMARTSAASKKALNKIIKSGKHKNIIKCIQEGEEFAKTKAIVPSKRFVYVPPVRPIPKKRYARKRVARLPVRAAVKAKPARKAVAPKKKVAKKSTSGLFGSSVPPTGSLFGGTVPFGSGGLFGASSGT